MPLILRTRSAPSRSMAMALGNHPVGIAPSAFQFLPAGFRTATALFPPHATYSVLPSGAYVAPIGWLPNAPSGQAGIFTSVRASVDASTSEIESEWLFVTASVF